MSDLGGGVVILTAAVFAFTGTLRPWMIVPASLILSSFNSLMWLAQSASITVLVPKERFGRANGMIQLIDAVSSLAGPALAGLLYVGLGLGTLASIDAVTYLFAIVVMIFWVRIPEP